ncbi:MAG: L-threonylcarbamoyladenylate synthase [Myxococcota bacterium]
MYGLAARFDHPAAVAGVFAAKERPRFDPLIVHIADPADLDRVIERSGSVPWARVEALTASAWPGPLTLVLPRGPAVSDLITAGLPTVAVRCPGHPVARELIARVGPLVAPSANRFGRISPTRAADVVEELGDRVEFVVDGGPCLLGVESTIVGFDLHGRPILHRPGGLAPERVEAVLGRLGRPSAGHVAAPGQTPSHYAPRTPMFLVDLVDLAQLPPQARVAWLRPAGPLAPALLAAGRAGLQVVASATLSEGGDVAEAAQRLFATLRQLDAAGADCIVAERVPWSTGLGHAIADRLQRASAPR